ncbi:hypothetical protein GCK32_017844, partial [Trichostrongylus colubriformis]
MDETLSNGNSRISIPVRSSSTDRSATIGRNQRDLVKRRTDADKSLLGRPRSPSMSSIQSGNDVQPFRIKEGSRLICRSVSPANGTATKEAPPRSVEKPLRTSGAAGATTKPPREPNRPLRDARVTAPPVNADDANPPPQRKNSTQGVTLDDIATKIEKGHYMIVMQAEKTSIG